ncbi:MAG: hypothetical protein LBU65_09590 [Planctomycetaceae bacterium]|nr:hypothetical protein [Planctomycetaceae bacterium]
MADVARRTVEEPVREVAREEEESPGRPIKPSVLFARPMNVPSTDVRSITESKEVGAILTLLPPPEELEEPVEPDEPEPEPLPCPKATAVIATNSNDVNVNLCNINFSLFVFVTKR